MEEGEVDIPETLLFMLSTRAFNAFWGTAYNFEEFEALTDESPELVLWSTALQEVLRAPGGAQGA